MAKTQSKEPSTMEGLLAATGYQLHGFKRGDMVTGRVTEITGKSVFVDVGGKTEGIVGDKEYELIKDYTRTLKAGDEVKAVVISPESDSGQMILSLKRAAADTRWKKFEQALATGATLAVRGKETTRGGLLVEADGLYGFIPASQFSKEVGERGDKLVGQAIQVKVIEVDRSQNRLVLSEKAVSEATEIAQRKRALGQVKVDSVYPGQVVGVVPFGAFVQIAIAGRGRKTVTKLEGLVHISEISWEKVEDMSQALKEGDPVEVKVIGVDEDNAKLALSIKQLTADPWLAVPAEYPAEPDSQHPGRVVKVMPYGVIVHLGKGIEGLIHASKMPADLSFVPGQEIKVFVESVDVAKRRLSLGVVLVDKPLGYK